MTLFPSAKIFVSFGSLQITWYALLILAGALCAYSLCQKTMKKWGYPASVLEDYLVPLLIFGILGARVYYVLFEWKYYVQYPNEIFAIWHGGLAIHGGLIAGVLFSCVYFKRKKISFLRMFDLILPNVLIAQAFGRWGNFANQEAFGQVVSQTYYQHFPTFIRNQMYINGAYRQPTFLFESAMNILGFVCITFVFRKFFFRRRGDGGFMYTIWYGCTRFVIEGMRTDSLMIGHFRIAQIVSLFLIVVGLLGLSGIFHRIFHWYTRPVVLLDHDGTLVATKDMIFKTWDKLFATYKPEHHLTREEKESFFGPTVKDVLKRYFPEDQIEEILLAYETINTERAKFELKAIPQVKETLRDLHQEGYVLGVVSNKRWELLENELKIAGIFDELDVIVGAQQCPHPKPDPSGLICACDQMGIGHDDVIYVGDSVSDIQAARRMGAFSIGFSMDAAQKKDLLREKPCRMMHDFSDLKTIVKEERAWSDPTIW